MVRIALFGVGRWGQNILRTLTTIPECEVSVVCDPSERVQQIVKEIAPHLNPQIATSWKEVVEKGNFDAAIIATPASTHTQIAQAILEKGISVFIEKPITLSVADAKLLEKKAGESGAKIFIGHIHLYNPAFIALKKELPNLGKLRYILCEGGNNGPYRNDMSALWDWAPHDIAALIDIFTGIPTVVDAWGFELLRPGQGLHDTVIAQLEAPNKTPITLHVSWLMPEKRKKMTFIGETSSLVFDDTAKDKVVVHKNMGPKINGEDVTHQIPEATVIPFESTSPLTNELTAFINAVTKNALYPTGITQGVAVTQVLAEIEAKI